MITTQLKMLRRLDNFVEKVSGVNKPYRALVNTKEYKDFSKSFNDAIQSQVQWAVDNLSDILHLAHPLEPLNSTQQNRVEEALTNMPALENYVNEADITDYLKFCFEWAVEAQYQRWNFGKVRKANFTLTNPNYIKKLNDRANYLLNKSTIDDSTRNGIIDTIIEGKQSDLTNDEVAQLLTDQFDDISSYRANLIARTETANAMGDGNLASMQENGVTEKEWITAGPNPCPICQDNEDAGPIPIDQTFPSGDDSEPAHPACECYTQPPEISVDEIDFNAIWDGA